jgi:hypothetical protein
VFSGILDLDDVMVERILLATALQKNEQRIVSGILDKLREDQNIALQAESFRTLGVNYAAQLDLQRQYLEYANALHSGIALALACERPHWIISALDVEPAAVALAHNNAERLGLPVSTSQSDWCAALADQSQDILVSNPPYIADDDVHLTQGDLRFEPRTALVAADSGMADIRRLIDQGRRVLVPEGWLFLEHGWTQGSAVRAWFEHQGYSSVTTVQDWGQRDRVSFGQWRKAV